MPQADIERFYDSINADPALQASLTSGVSNQDEFVDRLVAAAQADGVGFTAVEVKAWISANTQPEAHGELSDMQLEAIAGGGPTFAYRDPRAGFPSEEGARINPLANVRQGY